MVVIQLNLEKIVLHAQSVSSISEELQNEWKELFKLSPAVETDMWGWCQGVAYGRGHAWTWE